MRFDWLQFVRARGIAHEEKGKNTTRGNITIHCPWCGQADKSGHMGLSTDVRNPVWGCLRNAKHRGRDPARLVARLLGIYYHAAVAIVAQTQAPVDDFEQTVERLKGETMLASVRRELQQVLHMPGEFRFLSQGGHYAGKFLDYLMHTRGFGTDAYQVAQQYDLLYALTGDFAWRLIFPIYQGGELVGWTGRAIHDTARLRYRTSDDLPKDVVLEFGVDGPQQGAVELVGEGPMDALKLDFYGWEQGVSAIATMGTASSPEKVAALRDRPTIKVLVFDNAMDGIGAGLELADEIGARVAFLPAGVKDPGALTGAQAKIFVRGVLDKLRASGIIRSTTGEFR